MTNKTAIRLTEPFQLIDDGRVVFIPKGMTGRILDLDEDPENANTLVAHVEFSYAYVVRFQAETTPSKMEVVSHWEQTVPVSNLEHA